MTKSMFEQMKAGLEDALAFAENRHDPSKFRVHIPLEIDVKVIRAILGLSQAAFAKRFGFPIGTVRDWEQGRRVPDHSARILLTVIAREPAAVDRALAGREGRPAKGQPRSRNQSPARAARSRSRAA